MTELKQDITKLKTVTQYAKLIGVTRQRVYQMIEEGKVKTQKFDKVVLIILE